MAWRGHDPVKGSVVDASAKGVSVSLSVSAAEAPALPIGTSVFLSFEIPNLEPIHDILAVVRNERDRADRRIFGLEIFDWRRLHDSLPPRFFATFNRRRDYRVSPETETGVEVVLVQSGHATRAALSDISMSGCLLLFQPEGAPKLGDNVQLEFRLPGLETNFRFSGTVRSESEFRNRVRCGVEFEANDSREFKAQQVEISRYVMQRQRESR